MKKEWIAKGKKILQNNCNKTNQKKNQEKMFFMESKKEEVKQNNEGLLYEKQGYSFHVWKELKKGIKIKKGKYELCMQPFEAKNIKGERNGKSMQYIQYNGYDDLIYEITPNALKEKIIIKEKREAYTFSYRIKLKNLLLKKIDDEYWAIAKDSNQKMMKISSLYLYDQAKEESKELYNQIKEQKRDEYILEVSLNQEWMNQENRRFPVVVDPSIEIENNNLIHLTSNDVMFDEIARTEGKTRIGYYHQNEIVTQMILQGDELIQQITDLNLTFFQILLQLKIAPGETSSLSGSYAIYDQNELIFKGRLSTMSELNVDVTSIVKKMIENHQNNYTLTIKNSYVGEEEIDNDYIFIYNMNCNNPTLRPSFSMKYEFNEVHQENEKIRRYFNNNAGTTIVHVKDGSFIHELNVFEWKENALTVPLNLIFNSKLYDGTSVDQQEKKMSQGFKTNFHQRIIDGGNQDASIGKNTIYIDGKGYRHDFYERWYYKVNDEKHYILKEEVYLNANQQLKYNDYDVTYEEGRTDHLTFISQESLMNYPSKKNKTTQTKYYIKLKDDVKKYVYVDSNQMAHIPNYYYHKINDEEETNNKFYVRFEEIEEKENKLLQYNQNMVFQSSDMLVELEEFENQKMAFTREVYENDAMTTILQYLYREESSLELESHDTYFYQEDLQELQSNLENLQQQMEYLQENIQNYQSYFLQYDKNEECNNLLNTYQMAYLTQRDAILTHERSNQNADIVGIGLQETLNAKGDELNFIQESLANTASYAQRDRYVLEYYDLVDEFNKTMDLYENMKQYQAKLLLDQKEELHSILIDEENNFLGFDGYGRLMLIQDKYDNCIQVVYEKNGEDAKILSIFTKNQTILFEYNEADCLDKIIDSFGRTIQFHYDENQCIQIELKDQNTITFQVNDTLFYTKDSLGNILSFTLLNHKIVEIEKINSGCLINQNGLIDSNNPYRTIHEIYEYDVGKNNFFTCVKNIIMAEDDQISFINFPFELYCYDEIGNFVFYENDKGEYHCETFDQNHNCLTSSFFKTIHKLKTIIDEEDKTSFSNQISTSYQVDDETAEKMKLHPMFGVLFYFKNVNHQTSCQLTVRFVKDNRIQKSYIQTLLIEKNGFLMVPMLIPNESFNEISVTILFNHDIFKNNVDELSFYCLDATLWEYDEENNVISIEDGKQSCMYQYEKGKKIFETKQLHDGREMTTHYYYDPNQNLRCVKDSLGNCCTLNYNENHDVIEICHYNEKDASLKQVQHFAYDEFGNHIDEKNTIFDQKNLLKEEKFPNGRSVQYEYDYITDDCIALHTSCNGIHHANKLSYQYHLMTSASSKNLTFQYRYDTDLRLNRISIENITMLRYFITEHINFEMNSDMTLQDATIVSIYQKDYPTINEVYDKDKKIRKKEFDDNWMIYHYDDENRLKEIQSNNSSLQHSYLYNAYGQMVLEYSENTTKSYGYDTYKRLDSYNIHQENIQLMQTFTYVDDYHDMIQENSLSSGHLLSYQYDMAQRVRQETLELNNFTMTQEYTYDRNEENISPFIRIHSINKNQNSTDTYSYEYNEMGQITKIKNNRYEIHYTYDALNRLIREDNPMFNKTYFFTYDDNGNIITKSIFNFTFDEHLSNPIQVNTYSYGHGEWNDQLIAYNGQVIQYDNAGKPIQYRGHEITWDNYRNIESIQINDEDTLSLSTKVGLGRVEKDSHFGRFILQNDLDKVYYMRVSLSENESEWKFRYSLDKLIGFNYNGDEYIYQRNIQGDITHILDLDGNVICEYVYDAWGNHLVLLGNGAIDNNPSSIGNINPFRYRGYFYDVETGFYWLLSRYYDPEIGRFISPDSVDYLDPQSINGLNLYCYCYNNPISYYDPSGHSALLIGLLIFTGAMTLGGAIYGGVSAGMAGGDVGDVFAGIGKGALNGLILGGGISLAIGGFAIGGTTILGSIMATYGLSISANMLEVAITQGKKSYYDGDGFWAGANDINNAMFANSGNILIGKPTLMSIPFYGTRMTSKIPTIFNVLVSYDLDKLFGSTTFLASAKATLLSKASPLGLAAGYGLTAWQYYNLIRSIVTTPDFENSRWILY